MTLDLDQIAGRFPPSDEAAWRALVEKVLKGGDFERRLVARTADDLRIEPLTKAARDTAPVLGREPAAPWSIAVRVDHPELREAATLALADLEGGADELVLVGRGARSARGFGVDLTDAGRIDAALAGVMLDIVRVRLEPGSARADEVATAVSALLARRGHLPRGVAIDFGFDPIGRLVTTGDLADAWGNEARAMLCDTIDRLRAASFAGPFLAVDVRPVHEAGGSEAQEIATALAIAAAYLRLLDAAGWSPANAFAALSIRIAVDADQFLTIAKLRALRLAFERMREAVGLAPAPLPLHAETAWRMLGRRDPAVNMLRATIAVFAAGIGGADSIAVLPHTSALGLPDAFARRVARNTGLVLLAESGLARVADPVAGAGSIEALTDGLARAGWSLFQEIERTGGIVAALTGGLLKGRIAEIRDRRARDVATRRAALTGTSEFPNLAEVPVTVIAVAPARSTAFTDPGACVLPALRLAEPFEALRDRADAFRERHGHAPRLFLVALGPLAEHSSRTLWVTNAVAAGGIEALAPADGFTASADAGRAFAESGATIAVITGSDETYQLLAEATAGALRASGARHVVLAGRPGALEAVLAEAGVDGYLFVGQDLVERLGHLLDLLGA